MAAVVCRWLSPVDLKLLLARHTEAHVVVVLCHGLDEGGGMVILEALLSQDLLQLVVHGIPLHVVEEIERRRHSGGKLAAVWVT